METSIEIQKRLSEADEYNKWIYQNIRPFALNRVLDIGCSIGNITRFFLDREIVVGIDKSAEAIEIVSKKFSGHKNFKALNLDIALSDPGVLAKENIDTVLCINLLEHIEDDAKVLNNIYLILKEGGRLILLTPVIKKLYGSMDRADEHFRRYSKSELNDKLSNACFHSEKQFYMNLPGILGWYVNGKILKNNLVPRGHYSFFNKLTPFIAKLEGFAKPPIGLSMITICKKK